MTRSQTRARSALPTDIGDTLYKIIAEAGKPVYGKHILSELKEQDIVMNTQMLSLLLRELLEARRIVFLQNSSKTSVQYATGARPAMTIRHPNGISWGVEQLLGAEYGEHTGKESEETC